MRLERELDEVNKVNVTATPERCLQDTVEGQANSPKEGSNRSPCHRGNVHRRERRHVER